MKILTLASTKGGVGKSTTAALIADSFLRRGDTVCLVDFDIQRSVTNWAMPICKRNDNLRLLELDVPPDASVADCYNLLLKNLDEETDWVIIDTKGGEDAKQIAALAICDLVLAPSGAEKNEVTGVEKTLAYFKIALEATGDDATDPKSLLRVIYQRDTQFPTQQMLGYEELIHEHYGSIKGLQRSTTIRSFIGNDMTSDEAIAAAQAEGRNIKSFLTMQKSADELTAAIIGEFQ